MIGIALHEQLNYNELLVFQSSEGRKRFCRFPVLTQGADEKDF